MQMTRQEGRRSEELMIEALYLHIPFCIARCAYCDFATSACDDDARMDAYAEALCLQLRRASKNGLLAGVKTIYIGGGTPTHFGSRRLNSLVYTISLSVNLENVVEFTCEANPESLDTAMVADLFALGVNRFSIGAQSFDDAVLSGYGRVHSSEAIERAVACVKTRTENFSLDLICGGPGQDMLSWKSSLARSLELGAPHISVYPLMLEEGTPLEARVAAGECVVASEDMQADMMLAAQNRLEAAGMHRYEIASYALPGFESKHNSAYWTGVEYLGLGAGASSMLNAHDARVFGGLEDVPEGSRVRLASLKDDRAYADSLGRPRFEVECLTPREAAIEDLMLGMRRSDGVAREQAQNVDEALSVFDDLAHKGLVTEEEGRFKPTERGWLMGNEIFAALWDLA
jgi:oxygen-independent coproporphyrinogen-3 oxidase